MNLAHKYSYEKVFIAAMLILFAFFAVGFITDSTADQANIFSYKTGDYMADYHFVANNSLSTNPYSFNNLQGAPRHVQNYMPLSYAIGYVLGKVANYGNLGTVPLGVSHLAQATSSFFMFFVSALVMIILNCAYKGSNVYKMLLSSVLFMSSVFIFSYERGNLIQLAVVFTFIFILCHNNNNKVIKEASFVCLAIAAALKIFPALFGLLLVFEKKYKESARLILYGLFFAFVPFLFFKGGFYNLSILIENLDISQKYFSLDPNPRFNFRYWASRVINNDLRDVIYNLFPKVDFIICSLATALSCWHSKLWKKICQISLVIMILPPISFEYVGLYLFLAIILFFNEEQKTKFDWLYLALFVLVLNPYQIIYRGGIQEWNITAVLMNMSASLMLILLTAESSLKAVKFTRSKLKKPRTCTMN